MATETRTNRQPRPRGVVVDLPRPIMDALIRLAVREDRDVTGQARRLIADGLDRAGLLPTRGER